MGDIVSNREFSINDSNSSVSGVSIGNMIIPYNSMIVEYIFLSDKVREFIRNKCCEYNKLEVEKELINFIDQLHYVYESSKSQERGKMIKQLMRRFQEVVDTKRYKK